MDGLELILSSAVRLAMPLLILAIGELVSQRSGVTNIGLEGFISIGALTAYAVALNTGDILLAVLLACLAGALGSMLMAIGAVWLGGNQVLVGFALFILLPNLANFVWVQSGISGGLGEQPGLAVPFLSDIPLIGPALFGPNLFLPIAVVLVISVGVFFRRTRPGLAVISAGHDPRVAASKGVNVKLVRTLSVLFAGVCAGLAGASLVVGSVGSYSADLVDGRGLIALAIVILGRWTGGGVVVGAMAIGLLNALELAVPPSAGVPAQFLAALPWVVVLAALVVTAKRRSLVPRSL